MNLDLVIVVYFILLILFSSLGIFFQSKSKKGENGAKIYRICPCRKMAESGTLSKICMYSGVGGFSYSILSMGYTGFTNLVFLGILLFSMLCIALGWVLKKE